MSSRPGKHRDRVAVAHRLGEGAEVGLHAEQLLHAAARHAEAGLHLIDDHEDAVTVAQLARRVQILASGGDGAAIAHDRLDEERGDLVAVRLEHAFEPFGVVHRHGMQQGAQDARHAGAVGHQVRVAGIGVPIFDRACTTSAASNTP